MDLFTSWQRRGEFPEVAAAVIAALEAAGYKASVIMSAETFIRLILTDPADGSEEKVELSVDSLMLRLAYKGALTFEWLSAAQLRFMARTAGPAGSCCT